MNGHLRQYSLATANATAWCTQEGTQCFVSPTPQVYRGNNLFPLKVGLRWVSVNGLEWVQKWVKSGFLGAKVGKKGPKPTFAPTLNPFRDFHENPLFTHFKGGGNCFLKTALRQSRPSKFTGSKILAHKSCMAL